MTLQTEKSLRNVINQSPHAGAHINENIKGKYSKMAIKFGRNVPQLMFHGLTKTLDEWLKSCLFFSLKRATKEAGVGKLIKMCCNALISWKQARSWINSEIKSRVNKCTAPAQIDFSPAKKCTEDFQHCKPSSKHSLIKKHSFSEIKGIEGVDATYIYQKNRLTLMSSSNISPEKQLSLIAPTLHYTFSDLPFVYLSIFWIYPTVIGWVRTMHVGAWWPDYPWAIFFLGSMYRYIR